MKPQGPETKAAMDRHSPVLLSEMIRGLCPKDGGIYVDGTFGGGGYSRAILKSANCKVWAIDRDPDAQQRSKELKEKFPGRITFVLGRFSDLTALLRNNGVNYVDGITLDLGVSSMQLDTTERGFSFLRDGPLDMRMEKKGPSASEIVNGLPEEELSKLIFQYGGERKSRRIAKAIVENRKKQPFTRTLELADTVSHIVRRSKDGIHPATRTFQALRIFVNDELNELAKGLSSAESMLSEKGRLVIASFHSLEDQVVKKFLREKSGLTPRPSRHQPILEEIKPPKTFKIINKRVITPTKQEMLANPRARSARLRVAEKQTAKPIQQKSINH
jgi:16S rRNA (cytosine1402-N4)-methyltransferase